MTYGDALDFLTGLSATHHQRQYSDNFLETSNGRWLQSNGLQHSNPFAQEFGYYGQGLRAQRDFGYYADPPSTPPGNSRLVRKNSEGQVSTGELSPGLLDLHSFDTELLSEGFQREKMKIVLFSDSTDPPKEVTLKVNMKIIEVGRLPL